MTAFMKKRKKPFQKKCGTHSEAPAATAQASDMISDPEMTPVTRSHGSDNLKETQQWK